MSDYRVIRLLKNHIYPTYQLHAFMASARTAPADGLRLAALTTLEWLCRRLGEDIPEALRNLPPPDDYLTASDSCLSSLHLSAGFTIDIVSLPDRGTWTLQITEPDLGPDPGSGSQARQPVAGRVIETNIAYQITGSRLECGFQTVISDPEDISEAAETYRLAIIRRLAGRPDFGLTQVDPLTERCIRITSARQLKEVLAVTENEENDLPSVIFTQILNKPDTAEKFRAFDPFAPSFGALPGLNHAEAVFTGPAPDFRPAPGEEPAPEDPPYHFTDFAKYGISLCRTYLLEYRLLEKLNQMRKISAAPGEIVIIEPLFCGGKCRLIPYDPRKSGQDAAMKQLTEEMYQYPRGKEIGYGHISFLSAAREALQASTDDLKKESDDRSRQWAEKAELLQSQWEEQLREQEQKCADLKDRLRRQQQAVARAEQEKEALRQSMDSQAARSRAALKQKDDLIAALRRRMNQPKEHSQIAEWVKREFSGRIVLHEKAVASLNGRAAQTVDVSLICDALDFLATDYWERRYCGITTDEMNRRCAEKYGRPFSIAPSGVNTVESAPAEYKIKYFIGKKGKPVESPLDYHLRVGNRTDRLLRIYFLHDDETKQIVIGSLPGHLSTLTIQ